VDGAGLREGLQLEAEAVGHARQLGDDDRHDAGDIGLGKLAQVIGWGMKLGLVGHLDKLLQLGCNLHASTIFDIHRRAQPRVSAISTAWRS
jgi:hypothetical protein